MFFKSHILIDGRNLNFLFYPALAEGSLGFSPTGCTSNLIFIYQG